MHASGFKNRWVFVIILFFFLLTHQLDTTLLVFVATEILTDFNGKLSLINPIILGSLLGAPLFFLLWGFFYDRHTRKNMLSMAGLVWAVSNWLMAIAPTFPTFLFSNFVGGIDNASHAGAYVLVGDFFNPKNRGKILGLLYLTQPLAVLIASILMNMPWEWGHWRTLLGVSGAIGLFFSWAIPWFIREPKRGASEPALAEINISGVYQFDWSNAKKGLTKPSLLLMDLFGLLSSIPWFVLISSIPEYLREVHNLSQEMIYPILLPPLIALCLGYPLGGLLGDRLFRQRKSGRILVSIVGMALGGIFLAIAFTMPVFNPKMFTYLMALMGLFMSFSSPNIIGSILDITLPEFRGSAISISLLSQTLGAIIGPGIVLLLLNRFDVGSAIIWVSLGAWLMGLLVLGALVKPIPAEIEHLRKHMAYRSHLEARLKRSSRR